MSGPATFFKLSKTVTEGGVLRNNTKLLWGSLSRNIIVADRLNNVVLPKVSLSGAVEKAAPQLARKGSRKK
jgi:hypothetical protein